MPVLLEKDKHEGLVVFAVGKFTRLLVLMSLLLAVGSSAFAQEPTVGEIPGSGTTIRWIDFQINYKVPGAGKVFLLWGVDGWSTVPVNFRPPGTVLHQDLMYTPMSGGFGEFSTVLSVPSGAKIEYVFHITRQDDDFQVYIWDTNAGKDYLSIARKNDSELVVLPSLDFAARVPEKDKDLLNLWLVLLLVLAVIHYRVAQARPLADRSLTHTSIIQILCIGMALGLILIPLRVQTIEYEFAGLSRFFADVPYLLQAARYDIALILFLLAVHLGLLRAVVNRRPARRLIPRFFLVIASIVVLFSVVNITALPLVGGPVNYQWIYYSGFLVSFDARQAIASNLNLELILNLVSAILLLPVISLLAERLIAPVKPFVSGEKRILAIFMLLPMTLSASALFIPDPPGLERGQVENPLVSFVVSVVNADSRSFLFLMDTPIQATEFRSIEERGLQGSAEPGNGKGQIKNVVLVVMESVGARYLDAYGGPHAVTPHLERYRNQSLLFRNIYAHCPSTSKSLFSILTSAYPWISYRALTEELSKIQVPTLSSELKKNDYQIAFFSSADLRFQGADEFLEGRGFDILQDYRHRECLNPDFVSSTTEYAFLDNSDDRCTAQGFIEWTQAVADEKFFGVIWTNNAHYPYVFSGPESDYGVDDESFNKYLNALRESDEALGLVLQQLEDQGLSDSTLVVVVGDHGQAFGQHNQFIHATRIYEENVHVPLLLINPLLFSGEEDSKLGGLIDLAPTIMRILGLPPAGRWQGKDLLSEEETPRSYFYAPWSDLLFGYRENDMKYIYNASRGTFEIFDLQNDPMELTNIADQHSAQEQLVLNQLAAWIQFQDRYVQSLTQPEASQ